jgi:hypothetical protein
MTEFARHFADRNRDVLRDTFATNVMATVRRKDLVVAGGRRHVDPQTHEELVQRLESLATHLRRSHEDSRVEWLQEIAALAMRAGASIMHAENLRRLAFEDFQRDAALDDVRSLGDGLGLDPTINGGTAA